MKIMASELSAQNTDKTISESLYLGSNYVPVLDFIRNPCQQYHNQNDFNTDQYNDKSQNCHEEYCEDYKDRDTGPILYSVNATCTLSCSNNDDYDNLNVTEWGASSSDTAKESTLSDPLSSDKQSSPESNISPISTSSGSSGIQTSSGTSSELSSGSTGNTSLQDIIPTCIYMLSRVAIYLEIDNTANATVADMITAILNSEDISLNKPIAENLFTLWMCSSFLELQLKPSHKPVQIRKAWRYLLGQYSQCSTIQQERDEPKVIFKKNIFCPKQYEERIKDPKILELLYAEAKYNILEGRYPCETHHCITLGGIQARIELGPYNPQIHTINFFREQQWKFLPAHIRKSSNWIWLPISSKNSAEVRLLEQYKRIPQSASNKKLIRKYLEFCWSLPFYGAAFFQGQIEQPVRSLTSFMIHQDIPILVAINSESVYVIDNVQGTVLLGLKYEELSWEYARPSREDNKDCLPCLFLQFMVLENGTQVSKILQIFSRQAQMMDTLISSHVDRLKKKIRHHSSDQVDASINTINSDNNTLRSTTMSIYNNPGRHDTKPPCLSNKLNKLVLCTFDEDGRCIGKMGSWSFSY